MATVSFVGDGSGQSVNGEGVSITATATAGTLIHTYSGAGADLIKLWAANTSSASVKLTVEWGGVTAASNIVVNIPAESVVCVADRRSLTGSGKTVAAFAGTTAVINCWAEVWNAV